MVTFVTKDDYVRYMTDLERALELATPSEIDEWKRYFAPCRFEYDEEIVEEISRMSKLFEINLMLKYETYTRYLAMTHEDMETYEEELEDKKNWADLPIFDYKEFYLPPSKRQKR